VPHTHSIPPGRRCRLKIIMQKEPTYNTKELLAKIQAVDLEGLEIIRELIMEEYNFYTFEDKILIISVFNGCLIKQLYSNQ
jgi:hypothetical protein